MIPAISELRRAVFEAATPLEHPYKTYHASADYNQRLVGNTHAFGRLVYSDGAVGGLFNGRYLIARGGDTDESIWALALHLGLVDFGRDVPVDEVDAGWFWLFANPEGRLPPAE